MIVNVAVVLVNWNGWRDTIECLGSLLQPSTTADYVVVVDNASSDGSVEQIEHWCRGSIGTPVQRNVDDAPVMREAPEGLDWLVLSECDSPPAKLPTLLIIKSKTNRGFAGGNNLGISFARESKPNYYWLLNTDTVIAPDALKSLVNRAAADPSIGMTGSSLIYYWRPSEVQALGGASFNVRTGASIHLGVGTSVADIPTNPAPVERQTDYVVGASMLVSSRFVEEIGPMCEDYFLYFEEIDWATRGRGRFKLAFAPDSRVFHKVGGSSRKNASRLSLRYLYCNRLLFIARYFPDAYSAALQHLALQLLQNLSHFRWGDVFEIAHALWKRKTLRERGALYGNS